MMTSGALAAGAIRSPFTALLTTGSGTRGIARWLPGAVPHVVRNIGVIGLTTKVGAAAVISFRTANAGATATVSGNQIAAITLLASNIQNKVYYKSALLNTIVNPGQAVVAVVTTKSTQTAAQLVLYVEPKWETPSNIAAMKTG